jgi:hypothetical protein
MTVERPIATSSQPAVASRDETTKSSQHCTNQAPKWKNF